MTVKRDCQCPRANHQHGTYGAWRTDRCRCFQCRYAVASRPRDQRGNDSVHVPAVGTARRLQALARIGWGSKSLARRLGVSSQAVDQWRAARWTELRPETVAKITALYEELWDQPNDTAAGKRAALWAARKGWLRPLDLDDDGTHINSAGDEESAVIIDEIAIERAMHGDPVRLTKQERAVAVARMTERGMSAAEIGRRLRRSQRTVQRGRAA